MFFYLKIKFGMLVKSILKYWLMSHYNQVNRLVIKLQLKVEQFTVFVSTSCGLTLSIRIIVK